jgi:hypothetical protein
MSIEDPCDCLKAFTETEFNDDLKRLNLLTQVRDDA